MSAGFEEIDRQSTAIGEVSVRRRFEPSLRVDVYEVKLDDEFLMSSLFTVAEVQLAKLALAELSGTDLDVVVGGLGLGYTARAVLEDVRVRLLSVVEAVGAVIAWHERQLLPLGAELTADPRCRLLEGDFFSVVAEGRRFAPGVTERFHAVLVDIDHSPRRLLDGSHAAFYTVEGLRQLCTHLHAGGVFALWSDDPPDRGFMAVLEDVFASCDARVVAFPNPYTGGESSSTVYVAKVGHS